MAFDGNGNWTSPFYPVTDRDNGVAILASKFQTLIQSNLKESFENCILRDGTGKPTTNINWNGQKITNLASGTSSADAVNKYQLDTVSTEKVSKTGDTMTGALTIQSTLSTTGAITTPTPEANSNTTEVPTTAWVRGLLTNQTIITDYLIQTYTSGNNWFKKYKNGRIEQGGLIQPAAQYQANSFIIPFALAVQTVIATAYGPGSATNPHKISIDTITLSSFNSCTGFGAEGRAAIPFWWMAIGY